MDLGVCSDTVNKLTQSLNRTVKVLHKRELCFISILIPPSNSILVNWHETGKSEDLLMPMVRLF